MPVFISPDKDLVLVFEPPFNAMRGADGIWGPCPKGMTIGELADFSRASGKVASNFLSEAKASLSEKPARS